MHVDIFLLLLSSILKNLDVSLLERFAGLFDTTPSESLSLSVDDDEKKFCRLAEEAGRYLLPGQMQPFKVKYKKREKCLR